MSLLLLGSRDAIRAESFTVRELGRLRQDPGRDYASAPGRRITIRPMAGATKVAALVMLCVMLARDDMARGGPVSTLALVLSSKSRRRCRTKSTGDRLSWVGSSYRTRQPRRPPTFPAMRARL